MTDKTYYQAAAAEVAQGEIDQALWIKVSADLPAAEPRVKQAKYIQLRAQELAVENVGLRAKSLVRRWMPRTFWGWVAYLIAAFVLDYIVAAMLSVGGLGDTPIPLILFAGLLIAAIVVAAKNRS